MIPPHGGTLVNRILQEGELTQAIEEVKSLPAILLTEFALSELDNIACGLYSPLDGFMVSSAYEKVLDEMRLPNGTVWPIPIVLPVAKDVASELKAGAKASLSDSSGAVYGTIEVEEIYERDKDREAHGVYGTNDKNHPGVARLYDEPITLVGGKIELLRRAPVNLAADRQLDPQETRKVFNERGWKTIAAFQTRNPIHRAHEYLQKCALEIVDGLFINPLVGATKKGDVPARVRMDCYDALLKGYYPEDRVFLSTFPAPMRYAGPKEAIFHAICRKNYGCTHIIIGRDHAGVGDYYGTYEAQEVFDRFEPGELGIVPLKFEHAFYCRRCGQMATSKTCPHGNDDHLFLSGTKVRAMLEEGQDLPLEFTRPEVAQTLKKAYKNIAKQ